MSREQKALGNVLCLLLSAVLLIGNLSGCTVIRYWFTGDWNGDADLVVVSQSSAVIGSIALYRETGSRTVADARGVALLERGESYGLVLDEGEEACIVVLLDMEGREVGSTAIRFEGTRLYLTLWEDCSITVSEEET